MVEKFIDNPFRFLKLQYSVLPFPDLHENTGKGVSVIRSLETMNHPFSIQVNKHVSRDTDDKRFLLISFFNRNTE